MALEGTSSQHLTPAQLGCLVDGFEGPADAFKSLLHLRSCRNCRERLVNAFPTVGPELVHEFNLDCDLQPPLVSVHGATSAFRGVQEPSPVPINDVVESWASATKTIQDELLAAPNLASQLERLSPKQQRLALEARRYQTLGLTAYLLSTASRLWHQCPTAACRLAQLAHALISKLAASAYPAGLKADVQCRALAYLGNSLRLTGRLREAEERLTAALNGLERGTGGLRLRARVFELLAELHKDQRRFSQALAKANEARDLYQRTGDRRKVAIVRALYASILGEAGHKAEAVAALQALISSVPRAVMGENVYWIARQNLCHSLVENEQLWEARSELHYVRRWARCAGKPVIKARLMWVEAQLEAREGDFRGAAVRLERVRDIFLSNGLPYDAALACLDLATLYLRREQLEAAQDLAGVLTPIFRSSGIHREALASLRLIARALEKKAATTAQVKVLHSHLTRRRRREIQY